MNGAGDIAALAIPFAAGAAAGAFASGLAAGTEVLWILPSVLLPSLLLRLFHCPAPLPLPGLRLRARKCVCVPPNTGHRVLYYFQPVGPGNLYLLFFISSP